ncbi:Cuticlin-1, partial [Orchesella cincta]
MTLSRHRTLRSRGQLFLLLLSFTTVAFGKSTSQPSTSSPTTTTDVESEEVNSEESLMTNIEIKCATHEIRIKIPTPHPDFSGMVYPQGLSKNSSCLREYLSVDYIEYSLPLRSCNTMTTSSQDLEEEEYFNTIVLEPHPKGKVADSKFGADTASTSLPTCPSSMKIFKNNLQINGGAEDEPELTNGTNAVDRSINIGDPLQIRIQVHANTTHNFIVTNCLVRDGLGWAEETLVNSVGCPVDNEIMPPFRYSDNLAIVDFPAHKFPYSPTVYYSCGVKLCQDCLAPVCQGTKNLRPVPQVTPYASSRKSRRDAGLADSSSGDQQPAEIEVYNGVWVNEKDDESDADSSLQEKQARGEILCFKQRDFALAIAISGLFLMVAVLVLIFVLCLRRRHTFKSMGSHSGSSSIYSGSAATTGLTRSQRPTSSHGGGYSNTAYSHSSDG